MTNRIAQITRQAIWDMNREIDLGTFTPDGGELDRIIVGAATNSVYESALLAGRSPRQADSAWRMAIDNLNL